MRLNIINWHISKQIQHSWDQIIAKKFKIQTIYGRLTTIDKYVNNKKYTININTILVGMMILISIKKIQELYYDFYVLPTRYNCRIATNEANCMILVAFERCDSALSIHGQDLKFGAFDGKLY